MDEAIKKTVLIIDDDTQFAGELSVKFEAAGFKTVNAVTGEEALSYVRDNPVDYIVLDFIMPEMDGYQFYHTMRYDLRKNIPTIVLTNLAGNKNDQGLEVFVKNQTDLDSLVNNIKEKLTPQAPQS